jgi:phage terminase small subunit
MTNPIRSKLVPRFVEEFCKPSNRENATKAAREAGWPESWAAEAGYRLLKDVDVQKMIVDQRARVSREATITAADILRDWVELAEADASKIVYVRRVNCRFCHGTDHQYQWTAREYAEACDAELRKKPPSDLPDCAGGFGWRHNAEPHGGCPECAGEGVEDIFFRDTESLTGPERKLIAGIERTKDGLKVKLRDQDAIRMAIAKYLGMLVDRQEISIPGGVPVRTLDEFYGPLPIADAKSDS